ncbi:MAG: hypothetical protein KIT35_16630 [Piscinibacter sp.]|uniref:hypothetical protein n=1 Tax=Piscinibacter sp. TaxID=1903157 RepID=UPI00258AE788|nr:hypothetical protein [Piscinibacter sp.]MCW5665460.1 hypothetical protein [Piscinibacter sp.]
MTTYLLGDRPNGLPEFPDISWQTPSAQMRRAARAYLDVSCSTELLPLDANTMAVERPGRDADEMLTDRQFAKAVLEATAEASEAALSRVDLANLNRQRSMQGPFVVNGVPLGRGVAAMNSQVLRSAVFCRAESGVSYPAVGDRRGYELSVNGPALSQEHADLLLFLISRLQYRPQPAAAAPVTYTCRGFLCALGWSTSAEGYKRLERVAHELCDARLSLVDSSGRMQSLRNVKLVERTDALAAASPMRAELALSADLIALLQAGRNTVVDLAGRAALRGDFRRWLHAFVSSQKPGEARQYDAEALCAAGGLKSRRFTDDLKALREALSLLENGCSMHGGHSLSPSRPGAHFKSLSFSPVVASGWKVHKRQGMWFAEVTRAGMAHQASSPIK